MAHSTAAAHTYALGDATHPFNAPGEGMADVAHASRSLVWLKPDHILVYDRAETGKAGRFKRWWPQLPRPQLPRPATVSGQRAPMQTERGQQLLVTALLPADVALTAVNTNGRRLRCRRSRSGHQERQWDVRGRGRAGDSVLFPVNVGAAPAAFANVAPAGVTRHLITGLTPGAGYTAQTAAVDAVRNDDPCRFTGPSPPKHSCPPSMCSTPAIPMLTCR
jgi:hypothetical protein